VYKRAVLCADFLLSCLSFVGSGSVTEKPKRDRALEKRQEARDLFRDRARLQLPDPFAAGVLDRIRALQPLLTAAPILDPVASLRTYIASEMDAKAYVAIKRYALGRLVVLADEHAPLADELEATRPAGLDYKAWSKRKQVARRFFDLCRVFPAALGIRGVLSFCQQDGWTKILEECCTDEAAKMVAAGFEHPLKTWPAWARPAS
jgi:hypothetical protein